MTGKRKHLILGVVALCTLPAASQASLTLISENFDEIPTRTPVFSGPIGPFFTGTNVRIVGTIPTSVAPTLCRPPASGNCLNFGGTSGVLTSKSVELEPGHDYLLRFDLLGNPTTPAGLETTTTVTLGSVYNHTFMLGPTDITDGRVVDYFEVSTPEMVQLIFRASGPAGNNGAVLDNVLLTPEPATLGLMVLGLLGAGFAGRKRRN
jgi:hypothetical protein